MNKLEALKRLNSIEKEADELRKIIEAPEEPQIVVGNVIQNKTSGNIYLVVSNGIVKLKTRGPGCHKEYMFILSGTISPAYNIVIAESLEEYYYDKKPKPHNPDNLTPKQVGVDYGYRLLDEDEVSGDFPTVILDEIEMYHHHTKVFQPKSFGNYKWYTYRTKLTRQELKKARMVNSLKHTN